MKTHTLLATMGLALSAALTVPAIAASPAAADQPNADQILRQMSAKLAAAPSFTFQATRQIDPGLLIGHDVPVAANIAVTVQRPDKITAKAASKQDVRHAYADGQTFSMLDVKANVYATVPMRTSLDGLVEKIDKQYGFTPPLAEFVVSDPYKEFRRQANTVTYLGQGTLRGGLWNLSKVDCHRLKLSGHGVDAELWIGVNDQLLKSLVATFNDRPGKPQLKITFSHWNLAAKTTAKEFTFTPPKGALKIPMRSTAEMASAPAKTAARKN
jgi:hypothetical protein